MGQVSVAVIGKAGQARRLIELVKSHPSANLARVYYPKPVDEASLPYTTDFTSVLGCDAVIVAAPTPAHADYLRRLRDYRGYVLVEKPAVATADETRELRAWPEQRKRRLFVNYNLARSPLFEHLSRVATSQELGRPIYFDVHVSYGPAFKPDYAGNWRTDRSRSLGALESIGVHFVNMAVRLFGEASDCSGSVAAFARDEAGSVDTGTARFTTKSGVLVNLFHSHAAPYYFRLHLLGTNGYWEYDGSEARLYSPRDTYNPDGSYASPPLLSRTPLDHQRGSRESLALALDEFILAAQRGGSFDVRELELALDSLEPLLSIRR